LFIYQKLIKPEFENMLNENEQIKQLIENKKNILIVFGEPTNGDAIGSAVALALFLEKMGKRIDIISDDFNLPNNFKFLNKAKEIKSGFDFLQKFVISVDINKTGLQELSYDVKDNKLRIFITPKQSFLNRENIRTAQSDFKYDLIFVVDTPDLESLGNIYDNNTELFYQKPIINIDHKSSNENFGQINLIDITHTSTAESIYHLIKEIGPEQINQEIATSLLTGIISKTRSFKSQNIKPQTLNTASELINLGAERERIVQNLYRTKTIATLKLWGSVLSHLQNDNNLNLAWSVITRDDFIRSNSTPEDLSNIIEELLSNSPQIKLLVLLYEKNEQIHVILDTNKEYNALELLRPFGQVNGDKQQARTILENTNLKQAEEKIIETIKKTVS
jgi:nanoRNase/pAp phosphatase (c-di-AMP/oligoRNAs hydrolase)